MDQDLSNKVVLLRTDFNVPTQNNKIVDFTRINESIPTIKALIEKKSNNFDCNSQRQAKWEN